MSFDKSFGVYFILLDQHVILFMGHPNSGRVAMSGRLRHSRLNPYRSLFWIIRYMILKGESDIWDLFKRFYFNKILCRKKKNVNLIFKN